MTEHPRPPVILQVLPALQAGGVERGTVEIVRAIAGRGGIALVASAGGRLVPLVEQAGGKHIKLRLTTKSPLGILRNAAALARLIRALRVDIVHARSRAPGWSALLAARRTGVAFMTTWHGVYGEGLPFKKRYNSVMARGDRVIAISDFVAERISRDYAVGPRRLRVVARGADLAAFDPERVHPDRTHELARDWNLPRGAAVIMLAGRITPWKGHALLLEALARLPACVPDWVCVLVGPEHRRGTAKLLAQAARLGIAARLRVAGYTDDMPAALLLADVVVVPSLKPEPFGRVVVEAQAMGRPVVVGGRGAPTALAALLGFVLTLTTEDRANLAYWARTGVSERYSTQAMQAATLGVYDELLTQCFDPPSWHAS